MSFIARVVPTRWPARASIPVLCVPKIPFNAMQPSMHPSAVLVILRLREFVSLVPIAAQAMPDGAQHRCRKWRQLIVIEAGNERFDLIAHTQRF